MVTPLEQQQWYQEFLRTLSPEEVMSIPLQATEVPQLPTPTPLNYPPVDSNIRTSVQPPSFNSPVNTTGVFDSLLDGAKGLFTDLGQDIASGMSSASQFLGGDINMDGQIDGGWGAELGTTFGRWGDEASSFVDDIARGDWDRDGVANENTIDEDNMKSWFGPNVPLGIAQNVLGFVNPPLGLALRLGQGLFGEDDSVMDLNQTMALNRSITEGTGNFAQGGRGMTGAMLASQPLRNFRDRMGYNSGLFGGASLAEQNQMARDIADASSLGVDLGVYAAQDNWMSAPTSSYDGDGRGSGGSSDGGYSSGGRGHDPSDSDSQHDGGWW